MKITREEAKSLFICGGYEVLGVEALVDGYNYNPEDGRYFETLPNQVWWFIRTKFGWIKIGGRKRVINIDWSATDVRIKGKLTKDQTTQESYCIHAWTFPKAVEYLELLRLKLEHKENFNLEILELEGLKEDAKESN